jgi:hypothetical protein
MLPQFDIFLVEDDGGVLWVESAESLEAAQSRAKQLGRSAKRYVVLDHRTGQKVTITPEAARGESARREDREP